MNELKPLMIEALDYEAIAKAYLERARAEIAGWNAELESDPVLKLLEIVAYHEMLLRARINHAAASNLIAYAQGSDLDALAEFYGVTRMQGESDERLRERLRVKIAAIFGNGTREHYIARALAAHISVNSVNVISPRPGLVHVTIDSQNHDALAAVEHALNDPETQILGVPVHVFAAKVKKFNIKARLKLDYTAPSDLTDRLSASLRDDLKARLVLGRSLYKSAIIAVLHAKNVIDVVLSDPEQDLIINADELLQCDRIEITT